MSTTNTVPKKRRRIAKACDFCHGRGIKCAPSGVSNICKSCTDFGVACTYDRPSKRRGPQAHANMGGQFNVPSSSSSASGSEAAWSGAHVAHINVILTLADVYAQVVYPIFPFMHFPTFKAKIQMQTYTTDRPFFTCLMAVCALASARVRDGAVANLSPSTTALLDEDRCEVFSDAAEAAFPTKLVDAQEFDYLRASALLAILAIQNGETKYMHQYLGNYMTLVALQGLHDEAKWPQNISGVEREERRRLYWSMYSLEVFSSIIWGGIIRCREAQSSVSYPVEVDDEFLVGDPTDLRSIVVPESDGQLYFLKGWNHTTDLYRILEHAVDRFRRRRVGGSFPLGTLLDLSAPSTSPQTILDLVGVMHSNLPLRFKETKKIGVDLNEDRFNFQTANIIATMQLLKMVVLGAELEEASGDKRCQVAGELLDGLATIPTAYLRAISSPLIFQLAGIGTILGSVIEGLSLTSYQKIRHILLRMAVLLEDLETGVRFAVGASSRLRSHVERIDEYVSGGGSGSAESLTFQNPPTQHSYEVTNRQPPPSHDNQLPPEPTTDPSPSYTLSNHISPSDTQLPYEMLQDWPWPFESDEDLLFPDILSGWSH